MKNIGIKVAVLLVALCCCIAGTDKLAAEVKGQIVHDSLYEQTDLSQKKTYIDKIKFQGYGYAGCMFARFVTIYPSTDLSLGVRFNDYLYLGAEMEYLPFLINPWVVGSKWKWTIIIHEIFLGGHLKCYIPVSERLYPFADLSMGVNLLGDRPKFSSFGIKIGAGVDYKRFSSGIGYTYRWEHMGYVKFGVRF